jgi:hypothetical protein
MPKCCAGNRCKHPELGLQSGDGGIKSCPDCGRKIHDPCAIIDEEADLSKMNVCPDCHDARNSKPAAIATPLIVDNPYKNKKRKEPPSATRESESAAEVSENTAKIPAKDVSTLVHLMREFTKTMLPKINQHGQFYKIPRGASGRAATKQDIISDADRHIKELFPQYPFHHLKNPDIRASAIKVQGIWSTETKIKAMREFTVPEGLRFLVICPELFYRDYLERDAKFAVIKSGKCVGVLPPCPHCSTNANVFFKEWTGSKGDQGVRMTIETDGERHPVIHATWLCKNLECYGAKKTTTKETTTTTTMKTPSSFEKATFHSFSTLTDAVWNIYPEPIRQAYNRHLGGLDTDISTTLASRALCHHLITCAETPTNIARDMENYYKFVRLRMDEQYRAFIDREKAKSLAVTRDTGKITSHFLNKNASSAQASKGETWNDWPKLDYEYMGKYFAPLSVQTLVRLLRREYDLVKSYFRRDILSRHADEILRWDGTYKLMMKTMDSPDSEMETKVLLIVMGKLGHVLFWAFAEQEDMKSWQRINLLLAKRSMHIDPTGALAKLVVHAYSDTCCGDSPKDPTKHWLGWIYPNVKRAPGKDAFHGCKMITGSTNPKHELHDAFCKRVSKLVLQNDQDSEDAAFAAYQKSVDKSSDRELARRHMLSNNSYKKCIMNASVPSVVAVRRANELYDEFKKKDDDLRQASIFQHGEHHYKAYFTKEIHGKQRGTKNEIDNFIYHSKNGCYDDPLPTSEMFVPDMAHLPVKGNGLMPLFNLRGSGMVESLNWIVQLCAVGSTRLSAETVHMRLDIRFTKFNIDKDVKLEHVTGKKPHSFEWFLEEQILSRGRAILADEPYDASTFPADSDLKKYNEPMGREFLAFSNSSNIEAEMETIMANGTDFVTATLQAGGKVSGDLADHGKVGGDSADNYQEAEDHVSAFETPIDGDNSWMADAASVAPPSPSRPPAQVDLPQHRTSDMSHGSMWGRRIGGNGRATIATLTYDDELEGHHLETFLQLVKNCMMMYGTKQSESKLAELIQIGWRDLHFGLMPHNNYGLGGNLTIQRIKHHLKKLAQNILQTGMHVYSDELPSIISGPPVYPMVSPPYQGLPSFDPAAAAWSYHNSTPAVAAWFNPNQHPVAAPAWSRPNQHPVAAPWSRPNQHPAAAATSLPNATPAAAAAWFNQNQHPAAAAWFNPNQHPAAATSSYPNQYPVAAASPHHSTPHFPPQPELITSEEHIIVTRHNLEALNVETLQRALASIKAPKIYKDRIKAIAYLEKYFKKARDQSVQIKLPLPRKR